MLAALNSIRAGLEGFPPGSVGAVGETRVGTLRAGKAGQDRSLVEERPAFPFASLDPAQIALDSAPNPLLGPSPISNVG